MLQKVGERRKSREILWIRKFLRKMAKKAKVRRMRSEEGFIGREGEVLSRRFISRPFVSRRFISEPRAHTRAVGWESFLRHLTVERIRWEVIIA